MSDFSTRFAIACERVGAAVEGVSARAATCAREASEGKAEARAIRQIAWSGSGRGSGAARASASLHAGVDHLVLLTHDTELVVPYRRFLQVAGVDLTSLVPPRRVQFPGGNYVSMRQTQAATLQGAEDFAVARGELGVAIPVAIEQPGSATDLTIHLKLDVRTRGLRFDRLEMLAGGGPKLAGDAGDPGGEMEVEILDVVERELGGLLGAPPQLLPELDVGLGRPTYFSAGFFSESNAVRVFGGTLGRRRARLDALDTGEIPVWAHWAVKTAPEALTRAVRDEARGRGLEVFSGPSFPGANQIQYELGRSFADSVKVGCVTLTIKARAWSTVRCTVAAEQPDVIAISGAQIGGVQIAVDTSAPDFFDDVVAELIERVARLAAPAASFKRRIRIPGLDRIAVSVDARATRLFGRGMS